MRPAIYILLVTGLVFARAEVENGGDVVHIYDIPNSQITDQIQNVHIDTSIKGPARGSKNNDPAADEQPVRSSGVLQKAEIPFAGNSRQDTIAAVNAQIKFLFHKPIDASSINLTWSSRNKKHSLIEYIEHGDTVQAVKVIRENTALTLSETQWLVTRIWNYWITGPEFKDTTETPAPAMPDTM
jgi:hypothetical protein